MTCATKGMRFRKVIALPAPVDLDLPTVRELFNRGLDTLDIASELRCHEADVWRALARWRDQSRAS